MQPIAIEATAAESLARDECGWGYRRTRCVCRVCAKAWLQSCHPNFPGTSAAPNQATPGTVFVMKGRSRQLPRRRLTLFSLELLPRLTNGEQNCSINAASDKNASAQGQSLVEHFPFLVRFGEGGGRLSEVSDPGKQSAVVASAG